MDTCRQSNEEIEALKGYLYNLSSQNNSQVRIETGCCCCNRYSCSNWPLKYSSSRTFNISDLGQNPQLRNTFQTAEASY